jgi:hypothetical protein
MDARSKKLAQAATTHAATSADELQHDQIEASLKLVAKHFNTDAAGRCAGLTPAGFAHYAPLFSTHGVTLEGQETFRDLQHLKQDILQPYDDAVENAIRKDIREGKLKGPEMRLTLALLDGDVPGINAAASKLTSMH